MHAWDDDGDEGGTFLITELIPFLVHVNSWLTLRINSPMG